jgi:hypothetical protein
MDDIYPEYRIVVRVFYQVQTRRWETDLVKEHDGTADDVSLRVYAPGQWMDCMDSNGTLMYATRDEALSKIKELSK